MIDHSFLLAVSTLPQQKAALDSLVSAEIFFPIALAVVGALLLLFGFKAYRGRGV